MKFEGNGFSINVTSHSVLCVIAVLDITVDVTRCVVGDILVKRRARKPRKIRFQLLCVQRLSDIPPELLASRTRATTLLQRTQSRKNLSALVHALPVTH